MKTIMNKLIISILVAIAVYTVFGTGTRVDQIKKLAPAAIESRGWKILRYEGYQWGSWNHHGGKVWYHVSNTSNPTIQYRVYITLWGGELHFCYGQPENLTRINVGETQ